MQIVIDIDADAYKEIKKIVADGNEMCFMQKLIANGTPLSKGHGRLIDADALNRKDVNCANVPMNFIDTAPTIIEADKAAIKDAIIEEAEEYEADLDN